MARHFWAVEALSALAHDTRLRVFRLLVQAGAEGMTAGAIAAAVQVPASTMSHHIATLERAGLAQSERESRMIHYRADYDGMRRLLSFLIEDCCQQRPEMCADLVARWPASLKGEVMTDKTYNVLLLRTGNNAHAILGEARLLAMRFALGGT